MSSALGLQEHKGLVPGHSIHLGDLSEGARNLQRGLDVCSLFICSLGIGCRSETLNRF
jgi:hypothetical protein